MSEEKANLSMAKIFGSLLRADTKVLWRNRRASIMVLIMPIVFMLSWQSIAKTLGGPFVIATCITIGLLAIGIMGYANMMARDRENGVFQRLRVTPAPTWAIMSSRIIVQLGLIVVMTFFLFIAAYFIEGVTLTPAGYIFAAIAAIISGMVYLGIGQAIVGFITSAETINSVTRLIYIPFILIGALGEIGLLGTVVESIVKWSPYGTVKDLLLTGMQPSTFSAGTILTLIATIAYGLLFIGIGVRWFRWE